jgi:hypothetical protein
MFRRSILIALILGVTLCGCKSEQPAEDGRLPAEWVDREFSGADEPPPWPFWPTSMRIHPLTRVTTEAHSDKLVIETRIEFSDADGQTTKAVGQVRFELYADASAAGGPIRAWPEQDLRDLDINRLRYDDVTRTYLFPIDIKQDDLAGSPQLWAYFLSADGRLMKSRFAINQ